MNHLIIGLPNLPIQYMFYGVMNGKHIRYISSSNWNCTSKTIKHDHSLKKKAIDSLVVWNIIFYLSIYWEFHHPNWLSLYDFSEGSGLNHQPALTIGETPICDGLYGYGRNTSAWESAESPAAPIISLKHQPDGNFKKSAQKWEIFEESIYICIYILYTPGWLYIYTG